jgi:hypothetical protein
MYYTCTTCSKHMGVIQRDLDGPMEYPAFTSVCPKFEMPVGTKGEDRLIDKVHVT